METRYIFLIFLFSFNAFSNCDETISLLKNKKIREANIEYQKNCKDRDIIVLNEFGDEKKLEDKEGAFYVLFNFYSDCLGYYESKSIKELKSCIKKYHFPDIAKFLDSNFQTNFSEEVNKWESLLNKDSAAKKRSLVAQQEQEKKAQEESDAKKKAEEEKIYNSGEDLRQRACSFNFIIRKNQKFIDRENKIGKVSGFVDKNKLHKLGSEIVTMTEFRDSAEKEFLKRTGKKLPYNECRDPFDLDSI
jgi:hypothetical protein